jgi:hypothetical protein
MSKAQLTLWIRQAKNDKKAAVTIYIKYGK